MSGSRRRVVLPGAEAGAAADHDRLTGDEGAALVEEEGDGVGHVLPACPMRPAGDRGKRGLGVRGESGGVGLDVELRRRRAGADAVDGDPVATQAPAPRCA